MLEDVLKLRGLVIRDVKACARQVFEGSHSADNTSDGLGQKASQNIPDHTDGVKGSVARNLESDLLLLSGQ